MKQQTLLVLALACSSALLAQANTVPGLNGRLTAVDNLTYYGRRGSAYPNGEIGMAMLNTMCNPGSVTIPWYAAMQANHPKFGFLLVRLNGDRLEQISDWSYCKHAFTSTNSSGSSCGGSCISPGTGSVMGISCYDTYGAGNNADRTWLGPPSEIDPWLGTWNPVGSYFDVGDPATGTGPADGSRSLSTSGFDAVKNRMTVKEIDLTTAGASYFYGIHLLHEGESVLNRDDNLASRGVTPTWGGTTWSFPNNAVAQSWGSILQRWPGATVNVARNGNDDGRFFVAVKATSLGGGNYHYEYAVHNADNNRGGATFRVPVDPAGVASNFTFGDIDANPLNDWLAARVGNEIVWTAPGSNPQNWNTIYNFGFDCTIAPSFGLVHIDEARIGAGALYVSVDSQVPSGIPAAQVATLGSSQGCGSCTSALYEMTAQTAFDLSNSAMTLQFSNGQYRAVAGGASYVAPTGTNLALTDDSRTSVTLPFALPYPGGSTTAIDVCSNGFLSAGNNGSSYTPDSAAFLSGLPRWVPYWRDLNPGAGGQVMFTSGATEARVTWNAVNTYGASSTNTFQVVFRSNGNVSFVWQTVHLGGSGSVLTGWSPGAVAVDPGAVDLSAVLPAGISLCATPFYGLGFSSSARPVLGTTVQLQTTNIPSGTPFGSVVMSLVRAVPPQDLTAFGMPGCFGHTVSGVSNLFFVSGTSASMGLTLPNVAAFTGVEIAAQSFTFSGGLNAAGVVASNGLLLTLGPQ